MKNTITMGVALFVIGALVGFGADRLYMGKKSAVNYQQTGQAAGIASDTSEEGSQKQGPIMTSNEMPSTTIGHALTGQTSLSTGQNAVSVEDQKPGDKVVIQSVTLATMGWVVIHDDDNGKPGHILGAHRFNAGTYTGQNVELLKETEEGKVYYAMLHADDGDKQFDYRVDLPIKDETGNPVMMRFVATAKSAQ